MLDTRARMNRAYLIARPKPRLLIASATALFLELACIRWAGSHVLYLAYVANLLLITTFLGLGLGTWFGASLSERARSAWLVFGPMCLLAFVAFVAFAGFAVRISGADVVYFGTSLLDHALPAWLVLPLLGGLVVGCFMSLGSVVGRELATLSGLEQGALSAYSLDVIGSLCGIVLFSFASFVGVSAACWFALVLLGWLMLLPASKLCVATAAAAGLLTLGIVQWTDWGSVWSPYQRVSTETLPPLRARAEGDPSAGAPSYRLSVNNIVHQIISDVRQREPFYEFPYRAAGAVLPSGASSYLTAKPPHADWQYDPFAPRSHSWGGKVAVIGAGNGTDTAAALAYGAGHVDAVELDPVLAQTGALLQPNHPFNDARVQLHIMDGRTFLERTQQHYDVIVFGLPDSLTLASPYASVRLESFLFTEQAFASALRALDPAHGLLVIYNYYRQPWLLDRIAGTLAHAAGSEPLVLRGPDNLLSAVFIAGPGLGQVDRQLGHDWGYRISPTHQDVGSAVDDWPFLYLRERVIPQAIAVALATLLVLSVCAAWLVHRCTRRAPQSTGQTRPSLRQLAPFFLMGVAFLLLETSGLVRMSLLFGATWLVNALVFGAVLCMVLMANLVARRFALRQHGLLFVLLLAALALAFVMKPAALSAWSALPKYIVTTCVLFAPLALANLAFSRALRDCTFPAAAFAANLLGAVLGGALENLALMTGHSALLLVAAGLYSAAWLSSSREPATHSAVRLVPGQS
jgi:MFS family permease